MTEERGQLQPLQFWLVGIQSKENYEPGSNSKLIWVQNLNCLFFFIVSLISFILFELFIGCYFVVENLTLAQAYLSNLDSC